MCWGRFHASCAWSWEKHVEVPLGKVLDVPAGSGMPKRGLGVSPEMELHKQLQTSREERGKNEQSSSRSPTLIY